MDSNKHIYQEEVYAHELYERLQKEAFVSTLNAKLTILGEGVHWYCSVSRDFILSEIYCFDQGAYGPQYLTFFKSEGKTKAVLRTNSIEEITTSVSTWLYDSNIEILYEKHPSVDESKRDLSNLHQIIIGLDPVLAQKADHQLSSRYDEFYELMFSYENRSCLISSADHFEMHHVSFEEDQVQICNFREKDSSIIAQAINSWLIEHLSPTMIGRKFDGLMFSEIAIYYEIGRPIIGEFIQSWKATEQSFMFNRNLESAQAYGLLAKMREAGYDKTLRAGQSLMTLILSRSRRHGLEKGQPRIYFDFHNNMINVSCSFSGEDVQQLEIPYYSSEELSTEIIYVLDKLVTFPIT